MHQPIPGVCSVCGKPALLVTKQLCRPCLVERHRAGALAHAARERAMVRVPLPIVAPSLALHARLLLTEQALLDERYRAEVAERVHAETVAREVGAVVVYRLSERPSESIRGMVR